MSLVKLQVNIANQKYPIFIGNNILNKLYKFLKSSSINFNQCLIVADKNVPKKLIKIVLSSLPKNSTITHYLMLAKKTKTKKVVRQKLHPFF